MSSITVRNLDEAVKNRLCLRAARHDWLMAQEVRQILQQAVAPEQVDGLSFAERINSRFKGLDADALRIPARKTARPSPALDTP